MDSRKSAGAKSPNLAAFSLLIWLITRLHRISIRICSVFSDIRFALRKMKWELECAREVRRLLHLSHRLSWQTAQAQYENVCGDLSEDPKKCAQDEYEEWRASC